MGTSSMQRFTGCVKWFNNKSGYGFITASSGDMQGKDVFIHHSAISVANQQYKYLVQGEYVEFELSQLGEDSQHQYQAKSVTGISQGKLMCETHYETRSVRQKMRGAEDSTAPKTPRKRMAGTRVRGSGPRGESAPADTQDASADSKAQATME